MKVLLVGEYNRVHRNLKLGLEALGHEAQVVGLRDGFKKVKVDYEIRNPFEKGLLKKLRILLFKLFNIDILGLFIQHQIKQLKPCLSNYNIIQFINEASFTVDRKSEKKIFDLLRSWNTKAFLLSCGTDFISVKYANDGGFRYSILTPYKKKKGNRNDYLAALSCLSDEHLKLHKHIFKHINGVISNDLDYHLPLLKHPKYLGMIPHAINVEQLTYEKPVISDRIVIFHGINTFNYYKKGNDLFDQALKIIASRYTAKVEIITTQNLPYNEYLKVFNRCHILMDQVFAYDQGYNALEAMAKGKVVFTGAEIEFLDFYNLKEDEVAINALPDVHRIVEKLDWLICNPEKILEISKNARTFVEKYHDHLKCTSQYLKIWEA